VRDIIAEGLRVWGDRGRWSMDDIDELMEAVGIDPRYGARKPHQFSGGQCQRISVARALVLDPKVIICDEPVSALDVSVQAQILNLLHRLQVERGLTYLFITHDLSVVRHMARDIVVMYLGRVAEAAETEQLFAHPMHPYTRALLRASPDVAKTADEDYFKGLEGNVPDPARPPSGCRFHTRCDAATAQCGWEIDDVVHRLEDTPLMFEQLNGVERRSPFDADLSFDDEASARRLVDSFATAQIPPAMSEAVEALEVRDTKVSIRFRTVPEVEVAPRPDGRRVACVLDDLGA
ncbi:MAG: ABC transporter ATP-binding protein, partial [Acidimicrobiia bacterium]|nr:ABC transporter ATP-binding protein [Acidimicrobiia bacterium]